MRFRIDASLYAIWLRGIGGRVLNAEATSYTATQLNDAVLISYTSTKIIDIIREKVYPFIYICASFSRPHSKKHLEIYLCGPLNTNDYKTETLSAQCKWFLVHYKCHIVFYQTFNSWVTNVPQLITAIDVLYWTTVVCCHRICGRQLNGRGP